MPSFTDDIEWIWVGAQLVGMAFLWYILGILYEYREAARLPSVQNARRGHFVAVLLRFGRVCFVLHLIMFIAGVGALLTPNDTEERLARGTISILFALILDGSWLMTIRDFRAIQNYRGRAVDGGKS